MQSLELKPIQKINLKINFFHLIYKHFFVVVFVQNHNILLQFQIHSNVYLTFFRQLQPVQSQEKDQKLYHFFNWSTLEFF